jgi:hypothetical protein
LLIFARWSHGLISAAMQLPIAATDSGRRNMTRVALTISDDSLKALAQLKAQFQAKSKADWTGVS